MGKIISYFKVPCRRGKWILNWFGPLNWDWNLQCGWPPFFLYGLGCDNIYWFILLFKLISDSGNIYNYFLFKNRKVNWFSAEKKPGRNSITLNCRIYDVILCVAKNLLPKNNWKDHDTEMHTRGKGVWLLYEQISIRYGV